MLSDSIVSRALEIIENKTERAVNLRKAMCYVIYAKIHLKNAIEKQ